MQYRPLLRNVRENCNASKILAPGEVVAVAVVWVLAVVMHETFLAIINLVCNLRQIIRETRSAWTTFGDWAEADLDKPARQASRLLVQPQCSTLEAQTPVGH